MFTVKHKSKRMPKISTTTLQSWTSGVVTDLDDGRTPKDGLRSADNMILEQDGVLRPRPSLLPYGPQPVGTVLGRTFQFRTLDGLTATNWLINLQKVTQNEVQTLTITGTPTGGTFTLTYSGQTTSAIARNASAADVQTALLALSNLDTGDVVCTGGALPGTAVVMTFGGTLANTDVAAITTTSSLTGGSTPTVTVAETTKGGYTVKAHIAKPQDDTWVACTGATFSLSGYGRFFQLASKVVIMTGDDSLSYFDITTASGTPTVTTFTSISDVAAPTIANSGSTDITTGTKPYTIYYAVTANSKIGQTLGTAAHIDVTTQRSAWDKTVNGLKISWTGVTDAESYNVYGAVVADGDSNPQLFLLVSGLSADDTSYVDDGSLELSPYAPFPKTNSTAGPKVAYGRAINGRCWLWGDKDNPYFARYGGNFDHELDFSGANGSGYVTVGSGSSEVPSVVWNFRSGQGEPEIKVLTRGLNGSGKRYTLSQRTVTLGDQQAIVWAPQEDYGFTGTDAPDGLVGDGNNSYYLSRKGIRVLGTKPQLQNLLDDDNTAQTIQGDLAQINWDFVDKAIGLGYDGRLYWCLPVGAEFNSQIWVLDVQRSGAWMKPWSVQVDDMFLVQDNDGFTHHVVLSGNTFYEFTRSAFTSDNGVSFSTGGSTGLHYFSDDGRTWVRLIRVVIELLRPVGKGNFTLYGFTNKKVFEPIGSGSFEETSSSLGFGWNETRWDMQGWDDFSAVPTATTKASVDVPIKVNKDVRYIALSWSTTEPNVDYAISKLVSEEVVIGVKNLN